MTEDAKSALRCRLCGHEWLHGGDDSVRKDPTRRVLSLDQARAEFQAAADPSREALERAGRLKSQFLADRPTPDPRVAEFWARYQHIFSADGLPTAAPTDLKFFANTDVGAGPGNMSVFNQAWNELGDDAAAAKLRTVIGYLLRGPDSTSIEDRLTELIDPRDSIGMTGFRESLLTKVLCVMQPDRFLPILIYTSPAGGKREIAADVFDVALPTPERTAMTRGRLALWSNDLLVRLAGDGFADLVHMSEFLWWAKSQP
jgi:hypothetical protein